MFILLTSELTFSSSKPQKIADQIENEKEDWEDDEKDVVHFHPELLLLDVPRLDLLLGQLLGEPFPLQAAFLLLPQKPAIVFSMTRQRHSQLVVSIPRLDKINAMGTLLFMRQLC